jgi:hypothetical protein
VVSQEQPYFPQRVHILNLDADYYELPEGKYIKVVSEN